MFLVQNLLLFLFWFLCWKTTTTIWIKSIIIIMVNWNSNSIDFFFEIDGKFLIFFAQMFQVRIDYFWLIEKLKIISNVLVKWLEICNQSINQGLSSSSSVFLAESFWKIFPEEETRFIRFPRKFLRKKTDDFFLKNHSKKVKAKHFYNLKVDWKNILRDPFIHSFTFSHDSNQINFLATIKFSISTS